MKEAEFKAWLEAKGLQEDSIATRMSTLRRIERVLAELGLPYADLDAAYDGDALESTRAALLGLKEDAKLGGQKYRVLLPDSENPTNRLSNFPYWLDNYRDFRQGNSNSEESHASRIRKYALEEYIEPARARGDASVSIAVRDVHNALNLEQQWRNVSQSLQGRKFQELANVEAPVLEGPTDSTNTILVFDLGQTFKLNRDALERYRRLFLARYRDFLPQGFAAHDGGYYNEERAGKQSLIVQVHGIMHSRDELDDEALGRRLLDSAAAGKGEASWLFNWRVVQKIKAVRERHPSVVETAAGRLARVEDDIPSGIAAFVEATWDVLSEGQTSQPYSESRLLPSMLAALARPGAAYGINTDPFTRFARALVGDPIFGSNPMTRSEYERALELAKSVWKIMSDEWGWKPRDLWDVQGFVWAVGRTDGLPQADDMEETGLMQPHTPATNLILYGPPGTGKTYKTAYEAVRLCDGKAPEDRVALMARYRELVAAGQIAFTTFHQSYAYEDFVEGLRPVTGSDDDGEPSPAGFHLEPKAGVFREIATLAEAARKRGGSEGQFDMTGRRIFKMSLGRAGSEDHIYDAAVAGGYIATGWGGDIDWSDSQYGGKEGYEAILARWNQDHPGTLGRDSNISQLWCLRSQMLQGDIVVVSEGNSFFRGIAEITGPYRFVQDQDQGYSHQRPVRWLATFDEPLPVDTIYAKPFTQRACYKLGEQFLKKEALARLLSSGQGESNGRPDQFVLVIDEINRANISKVFGELITLLESGKRLGAEDALTVTLPYSRIQFGVPENLHIVGTMNTADRSIALLDTALRRRFEFLECMPVPELLQEATAATGANLVKMLTVINQRIEYLFDREHQIGHAYLIGCRTRDDVDAAMRHRIIPLLTEYFYDDWSKVAVVLGDASGAGIFLERTLLPVPTGLADAGDGEPRYRWSVRPTFEGSCYDQFT